MIRDPRHRQKILPGDSKNSTVDGQSQLTPCGHEQTFPTYLPYLPYLPHLPYLPYLPYLAYLPSKFFKTSDTGGRYISSVTSSIEYTECQASCQSSELVPMHHPVTRKRVLLPPLGPKGDTLAWGGESRGTVGGPNADKGADTLR